MNSLSLNAFFDPTTWTLSYVVWDSRTRDAVVIDSLLDYDPITQLTSLGSVRQLLRFARALDLRVHWILETHAHADHLTAARELRPFLPGSRWAMGERMAEVFRTFHKVFAWPGSIRLENLGVDQFFRDQEEFTAGSLRLQVMSTPGHTPACLTYRIGDWLFTGDALMMPDAGVGRCDFPGGSASDLYDSIWGRLYGLEGKCQVFVGHDYQPGGRQLRYQASLQSQRERNIHLRQSTSRAEFVAFRESRDKTLSAPRLLQPSLDWNLGAHQIVRR